MGNSPEAPGVGACLTMLSWLSQRQSRAVAEGFPSGMQNAGPSSP